MMRPGFDMTIHISTERAEVVVEQQKAGGVTTHKHITPQALCDCFLNSRYDDERHPTGLLPEGCIAVTIEKKYIYYFMRYPELYADVTYHNTEYRDFPLPQLVFGFQYMPKEGKVAGCRVCVVKDERLTPDTPTYRYPFSNVHGNNRICTGNNALPIYKNPARLHTLMGYLLRLPNNDDLYSRDNNRLHAEYRDLLEQMKGKTPSHYYTDVLVEDGKTLKDFLNGR